MFGKSRIHVPKRCVCEVTLGCNLRCRHCGSRAGRPRSDELSTDEARDLFIQLAELGCERVTISGGEPLLRQDWPDLIEAASRTGMRVGMITNAVAFDDRAALLARDKGLKAIGFSLDGPREVHDRIRGRVGHFGRITAAMDSAVQADLPFAVVSFVNTLNIGRLHEMYDLISSKGAFAWQVQLGTDMGNMHDNPELLINPGQLPRLHEILVALIQRNSLRVDVSDSIGYFSPDEKVLRSSTGGKPFGGCAAGIHVIGIESNGNVKGCLSIMAGYNKEGDAFIEGNIREEHLADIWHRPGAFAYNRQWSIDDLEGFCRECKHVKRCRGGCRAKMTASGKGVENPMCVYRVACEDLLETRRTGTAAAAVLASMLGSSVISCSLESTTDYGMPEYDMPQDAGELDGGSDTDTDTDMDTDTGTDTDTDTDTDSNTDSDTNTDTKTDSDTDTDTDTDTETDTAVDEYNLPDY